MESRISLKGKMITVYIAVIILSFIVVIPYIANMTKKTVREDSYIIGTEQSKVISYQIKSFIEDGLIASRILANTMEGLKESGFTNRAEIDAMLKKVVEKNDFFLGAWTVWEPDAFDGNDYLYRNSETSDETGRLIPYWVKSEGHIIFEKVYAYETDDFYLLSKNSGIEAITEPAIYKIDGIDIIMVSVTSPVKYNNQIAAVAGIDMKLDTIYEMVSIIRPYETGYVSVISSDGIFVGHYDKEKIGRSIDRNAEVNNAIENIKKNLSYSFEDSEYYRIYTPIKFGNSDIHWAIETVLPLNKILQKSNNVSFNIIISSLIMILIVLVVVIFIVIWFTGTIIKPITSIIQKLTESSEQINISSTQLSQSSQDIANGSTEQAAQVEETSSSIEELASMVKQNALNANKTSSLAVKTSEITSNGYGEMENMVSAINIINKSSDDIKNIIDVIEDIAFQTNMLALNASVEAARAGESGMGFAVVADEVKNLANRSSENAKEIAKMIKESIKRTEDGVITAGKLSEVFSEILENVKMVMQMSKEVETASNEQDIGINQVNSAIIQFDTVVQSNAANAEETATAAEELRSQVTSLNELADNLFYLVTGKGKV